MKVEICVGTTCHLMGSNAFAEIVERHKLKYIYIPCFNFCNGEKKPPVIRIDDIVYEDVTPEKLDNLLRKVDR